MITGGTPTTPEVAVTTYRILTDEAAATMHPEDAAARDAALLALTIAEAYATAAELAVFTPMLAARLLIAHRAAEQPGQEDAAERTWNRLMQAHERTVLLPLVRWQELP